MSLTDSGIFLLAMIKFYDIAEKAGIEYDPKDSKSGLPTNDLDKIARNFGKYSDTFDGILYLCGIDDASRDLRRRIWNIIESYRERLRPFWHDSERKSGRVCQIQERYLRKAEDFFFEVSQKDEARLIAVQRAGEYYRDGLNANIFNFVGGYFGYFSANAQYESYSLEYCTGALLMMSVPIIVFVVNQSKIVETMASSGMKD